MTKELLTRTGRLGLALTLGLILTLGLLRVLNKPFSRPPVSRADDRQLVGPETLRNISNQITANAITIDDRREGWEATLPYPDDPADDAGGPGNVDWITITIAHDCDDLYVRYEVQDGPPFNPDGFRYNLFADVDMDRGRGYIGASGQLPIGADVLLQGGYHPESGEALMRVWRFTGVHQTDWSWAEMSYYRANDDVLSGAIRDIEWRILIAELDVFGAGVPGFHWVAFGDNASGVDDYYPDGGNGGGEFYTYTFTYTPTTGMYNPERGFSELTEAHSENYVPLDLTTLRCYRKVEGTTLVQRVFYLEDFVSSTISMTYLDNMQDDFDTIREAGLKAVVRFAYTARSTAPYGDASKEWILTHTEELSGVLQRNSDVIAVMQAGFIGAWGEWWSSDHFQPDGDWDDRRKVLSATLDMLPTTRMVQLRAPRYKMLIFDTTCPVCPCEAHSGTNFARTGHHNDCFLSSPDDWATYKYTPTEYIYLRDDTKYVVMGGETCNYTQHPTPDPNRLKCETALTELERFHWSFLNLDWYKPTLQRWRESGCFTEIEQRLGYRFTLLSGKFSNRVKPGDDFTISLQLENKGFAAPYNPRDVELILRHTSKGSIQRFKLSDDPRFWLPGETHTISHSIRIPQCFRGGNYELLLNLPDPEPTLHDRPEYAIRLTNIGVWEPETGYNKLNHTLVVEEGKICIYLPLTLKHR